MTVAHGSRRESGMFEREAAAARACAFLARSFLLQSLDQATWDLERLLSLPWPSTPPRTALVPPALGAVPGAAVPAV